MEGYARAHQAFANGTLKDTGNEKFDIIVDLNILDVILFGDKFTAPQNSSPFFPHKSIAQTLQALEDKNNASSSTENTENSASSDTSDTETTSGENSDTSNTNTSEPSPENTQGETSETPENSGNSGTENVNISNIEEFCIDPDVLIFSGNSGKGNTENSGSAGTSPDTGSENSGSGDGDSENSGDDADTEKGTSLSDEEMQNGNYFSYEDRAATDKYPDLGQIEDDERARGYRKDCGEKERPLFGGRMCVPDFCTEIFCVRVYVKEGHKQTNLRALDCVECHIDKGNEALVPMISTLGQGTPHTNPMEPNFMGAFATFGGAFSGVKIYTQPKKLPFLVYDQGDSLTDQKKKKAEDKKVASGDTTEKESTENSEKKKSEEEAEKLKKLVEKNQELFDLMLMDCSKSQGNIGDTIADKVSVCSKNKQEKEAAYDKKYASEYSTAAVQNSSKSAAYKNVVEPFFYGFSEDMRQINLELKKIDSTAIERAGQQCK